jgi:formate hydrogenlyase subunit 6/NADH:ubiquinone oxidoreductase subunit I
MYPVIRNEFYPTTRGKILCDESTCNYCGLCARRCPSQAITVEKAEKTWKLDSTRCLTCNFCVTLCSKDSLSTAREYALPIVKQYDAWFFQAERIAEDVMLANQHLIEAPKIEVEAVESTEKQ